MKGKTNFNNYKLTNLKTNNIKLYNSIRDISKDIGLNIYTVETINKINDGKLQRKSHVVEKYLSQFTINKIEPELNLP
jgi:hypothetical protein